MQCARHNRETLISCGRCDAPVCPRCMVYTDVGVRCRDCSPRRPGRPVWGSNSFIVGAVVVFLIILAIGSLGSVGLYSSGDQDVQDFVDELQELQPEITVEQIVDPWVPEVGAEQPAEGRRFVAMEVTIRARNDAAGQFGSPSGFKLTDSEAFAYSAREESPVDPALGNVQLAAGEKTAGWVVFEIDESNEITSLTYNSFPVDLP